MGWAKEVTYLHSGACLEIELQRYITISQISPAHYVYVPTSGLKWLCGLQNSNDVSPLSLSPQSTTLQINMIYQECGVFYYLYNCLNFMASSVCNGDK